MAKVFRADLHGLKHDKIKLGDKEFDLTALTEEQFQLYNALQLVESELQRLQHKVLITQSARTYHSGLLRDLIAPKNA